MDQLTIQEVTADNFTDLLYLIGKLAEYENLQPPDMKAQNRLKRDCLSEKPKYKAYLAQLYNKPVAYMTYYFTYSTFLALPTLYLEDLFVLQDYRRQGVGEKLFTFVKEIAKHEGCGRIEFTALEWNTSAQQFYEKNGAKRLDWFFYRIIKEDF